MSDTNSRPNKDGSIRGDSRDLPMKSEGSFATDSYGADLGPDATNRKGRITGATGSDPMDQCHGKSETC